MWFDAQLDEKILDGLYYTHHINTPPPPLPDFQAFLRPLYLHKAWTTLLQICVSYHIVLLGHNGTKVFHIP
jgi:hypothetical protein